MPESARTIKARLRRKMAAEQQRREEAVVSVGTSAAAALKARADQNATLRATFEAALNAHDDDGRADRLRATFEAALGASTEVIATEIAAGRAVLEATSLRINQSDLAELTGQRVEDLRRWAQAARSAGLDQTRSSASPGSAGGRPAEPATGYALTVSAAPSEADDEGQDTGFDRNRLEPAHDEMGGDEDTWSSADVRVLNDAPSQAEVPGRAG